MQRSEVPAGCKSLTLICVDPDAPAIPGDVNKAGRTLAVDLPRTDFHHWVIVDLPASCTGIAAGECSDGVTAGGKPTPSNPEEAPQARQGRNDYTGWFAGDPEMGGTYLGYDGPAPPLNDERVHHYYLKLYAVARRPVPGLGGFRRARGHQGHPGTHPGRSHVDRHLYTEPATKARGGRRVRKRRNAETQKRRKGRKRIAAAPSPPLRFCV